MNKHFKATICNEYFTQTNREIDWEENDNTKIPINKANEINKILSCEISIFLLRDTEGVDGSIIDSMVQIRRDLINQYEKDFEKYIEYNDFY